MFTCMICLYVLDWKAVASTVSIEATEINVNAGSWVSTEMCTYYSLNFIFHFSDSAVLKTKQEQKPYINQ